MICVASLAAVMGLALCQRALGEEEIIPSETCLDCHSDEDLTMERADGKEVSIFVDEKKFKASVHETLECADCHEDLTADHPDDEKPAAPVNCAACHEDVGKEFAESVHGAPRSNGMKVAATCTTCHGSHDMVPVKHLDSPVSKFNLPQLCGTCHEDEKTADDLGLKNHDAIAHFRDSIHGQSLFKKGLIFAPSCNDCHGVHDIKPGTDANSRTNKKRISETCTTCHKGVQKIYAKSVHGELLAKGDPEAPVCTDCHTTHDIERPSNAHFKANSDQSCGKCHEDRLEKYHETYHGKAMALGMTNAAPDVAACYDCHGHHDVLPHTNPDSKLSAANIVGTCQQCHAGAGVSFTKYQPHADPHDAKNYPALNKVYWFMTTLLLSVFGLFGIHTLLWVGRAIVEYARDPQAFRAARMAAHLDPETYRRFTSFERLLHILVVSSFLTLVITGMPLKFYYTAWAKAMFAVLGGPSSARTLHHLAALVTFLYFSLHLSSLVQNIRLKRGTLFNPETGKFELGRVWKGVFGPDSMVPSIQDLRDFMAHVKWFFGKGPRPQWDRWTYWERFDYFAVFWGVAIIGFSGLVLWFPKFFSLFLPGWCINIAVVVHSDEALLAAGFIFTFHFFNTHFRIDRFPMDMVIFSGHITKTEMLQERRRWYDRLVANGELEKHRVIHQTWEKRRGYYRALGFFFLATGVSLLGLMVYALLSRLWH
jgi:cytochrome b subunit of formate dehydrogenase